MDTPGSTETRLPLKEANQRGTQCMSEALGKKEDWGSLTPEAYAAALKSRLREVGLGSLPPDAMRGLTDDAARDVWYVLIGTELEDPPEEDEIGHMFEALKLHGVVILRQARVLSKLARVSWEVRHLHAAGPARDRRSTAPAQNPPPSCTRCQRWAPAR
jgi:hypothetical protein